jgi:hypothetical protein
MNEKLKRFLSSASLHLVLYMFSKKDTNFTKNDSFKKKQVFSVHPNS